MTFFVDDVGTNFVSSSAWTVAHALERTCAKFLTQAKMLGLRVSPESLLLTSSVSLDRRLRKLCAKHNWPLTLQPGGRDLGLWLTLRGRRTLAVQGKRLVDGGADCIESQG